MFRLTLVLWLLTAPAMAADVTLMPLGDSRVSGGPGHVSWRFALSRRLTRDGCRIDLIGPRNGPAYTAPDGSGYDADHAGVSGFTTRDVLRTLPRALARAGVPDIAIVSVGGNDLLRRAAPASVAKRTATIVRRLQEANPSMIILVEQIPPGHPTRVMTPRLTRNLASYNAQVADLAAQLTTPRSRVVPVNAAQGWAGVAMLADPVHYNAAGASHVAQKYHRTLTQTLGIC